MLVMMIAASAATASVPPVDGLTYSVSLNGVVSGDASEWVNITGEITYDILINGSEEIASPAPALSLEYSEGLRGVSNAGFSIDTLKMKLNSTKSFRIKDPVTGALNPLFIISISDIPAVLQARCGAEGESIESKNVSTTVALTTYEGRDSLEYLIAFRVNYTDGSWARILTHSIIDLATLEPLHLSSNLTQSWDNCSIEVRLEANLKNPEALPGGGVSEHRVVTSKGDAVIVIGGAENTTGPALSGEDAVTLEVMGKGRAVVVVAHSPSASAPEIVVGGEAIKAETHTFGLGTAYTIGFLSLNGQAEVEIVFKGARVALPWTGTPPEPNPVTNTTSAQPPAEGPGPLPYVVAAVIAAVLAASIYLLLRRE